MGSREQMRVLSLWEPWATLMMIGAKRIETRSWSTSYRGWIAIHAAKETKKSRDAHREIMKGREAVHFEVLHGVHLHPGRLLGVVNLLDCLPVERVFQWYPNAKTDREMAFGNYSPGRYAWVTNRPRKIAQPLQWTGQQGLRVLNRDEIDMIESALVGR